MYDLDRGENHETSKSQFIIFPCGSGNALCSSISYEHNEIPCVENCLYLVFRGTPINITLSIMNTKLLNQKNEETCKNLVGLISFSWGLIADVDIESDFYKSLGETKYIISGIKHVIAGHKRIAKLQYKSPKDSTILNSDQNKTEDDWIYASDKNGEIYRTVILSHIRSLTTSVSLCNDICIGYPGYILTILKGDISFTNLIKLLLETNYQKLCKQVSESVNNSPKKSKWIDQFMIKEFRMETLGGRLVIDGEYIHEGKFYIESKVAPFNISILGFKSNS